MATMYEKEFVDGQPATLCEWVRNFRLKRMQMKRKLRGNLRVCAMLTKALVSAEQELRHKQQERFGRWLRLQSKLDERCGTVVTSMHVEEESEEQCKQREQISNLWKCELSDLDEFMRAISSNGNGNSTSTSECKRKCSSDADGGSSSSSITNISNSDYCDSVTREGPVRPSIEVSS